MNSLLEKLTIAIPIYNDAKYIAATVDSCAQQAGQIIIYDNASTDDTLEICTDIVKKYQNIRHVRHAENIGAFENFKRGLFACETEYFCWLGSHDLLGEDYSLPLLQAMSRDTDVALVAGTIVMIDENSKKTGDVTRSVWANTSKDKNPLERVGACVTGLRRDCSIFYGIYRTEALRAAWFDTPCLGFDRVMLARVAALGKIVYVPESVFYARNFDKSRNSKTDRERRTRVVGRAQDKPLPKNTLTRNLMMVETVLAQVKTAEDLTRALHFIDKINRRYQSRRFFQKARLIKIIAAVLALALFVYALAT